MGNTASSYIYRQGTTPNTRAAVSQKNKIYGYTAGGSKFQQLGALSEFSVDNSRNANPYRGIGYGDQIAELVPDPSDPMTISVNKTLLNALNLFQSFGYKGGVDGMVRALKHTRWPFDIKQELVFSELTSSPSYGELSGKSGAQASNSGNGPAGVPVRALQTIYEGCWMTQYGTSYTADASIVSENSSIMVTDILDGVSTYGEYIESGLSPFIATDGHSHRFQAGEGLNSGAVIAGF